MRQNVGLNCRQTSRKNRKKNPYLRPESKVETRVKFQHRIGATASSSINSIREPTKNIKIPLTTGLEIVVFLPSIWMQTFAAISRSLMKLKEDILTGIYTGDHWEFYEPVFSFFASIYFLTFCLGASL